MREANLELITRHVFAHGEDGEPISRARLAVEARMTRSTSSRLVDALIEGRIIEALPPVNTATRGRPAVPLIPARNSYVGLGMEISVGMLAARLVDLSGRVLAESLDEGALVGAEPGKVLRHLGVMIREILDDLAPGLVLAGATLSLPGLVDRRDGRLLVAPNLGWTDLDPYPLLAPVIGPGVDFSIGNSANLAARAVAQTRPGRPGPWPSFVYLHGEIGVGAAIRLDGREFLGAHGWAGEIGHMTVDPAGPPCRCGSHGCLEQYIGRHSLLHAAGLPPRASVHTLLGRVESGDPTAVQAVEAAGHALGSVLSGVVNLLDLPTLVLGGDLAVIGEHLRAPIAEEMRHRLLSDPLAAPEVVLAPMGPALSATGAAYEALDRVILDPARWLRGEDDPQRPGEDGQPDGDDADADADVPYGDGDDAEVVEHADADVADDRAEPGADGSEDAGTPTDRGPATAPSVWR
ncbi:ROK family protein [Raineyella sp.]|nr:ROK family protein [Raineyella sp.]MEA5154873.1 ROK family protein [Raineyella sp.]